MLRTLLKPNLSVENQLARVYDRQHRLRLVRQIARFLQILLPGVTLVGVLAFGMQGLLPTHKFQAIGFVAVGVLLSLGASIGAWQAQRERLRWAAGAVLFTTALATTLLAVFAKTLSASLHLSPQPAVLLLSVGIIVVGLLGTSVWIVATTLFLNILAAVIIGAFWPLLGVPSDSPWSMLVTALLSQWLFAALMLFNRANDRRTIADLRDAQIANERAVQLDDLKDQFISSVNHELRNPMMALMNYVTILRQRHQEMPAQRRAEYLDSLDETGRRVIQLIGSILDIRQLTQHPEDFEPAQVAIKETLVTASQLLDPTEARMAERDLYINIPASLTIWGNAIYLQQIFTNLLSNAIKYSPPATTIEVRAQPAAQSLTTAGSPPRAMVEIVVRDHGLGIPPAQIPLLFNRFVRLARDLTSSTTGNGLGLYLCKVLTEAMGGQIWVESSGIAGEGSTFHILLPAEPAAIQAAVVGSTSQPTLLRLPIRQARLALAGGLALIVLVAGILMAGQPPAPTRIVNTVQFFDSNGGIANGVDMHVTGLSRPAAGASYQAWLLDATTEQFFALGPLSPQAGGYGLHYAGSGTGPNLLGAGNEVEITLEHGQNPTPLGRVVLGSFFPAKAMVHVRHLLVSFPITPANIALLVGLRQQSDLLAQLAQQLAATGASNPTLAHCLILSQLTLIEGSKTQPLPTSCQTLRVSTGDGYGLLPAPSSQGSGYIDGAINHTALALQQTDATAAMRLHGAHVTACLNQIKDQAATLDGDLRQLATHFDASQLPTLVALANRILAGTQGSAVTNHAAPSFDNVTTAYTEGLAMAEFTFTSR